MGGRFTTGWRCLFFSLPLAILCTQTAIGHAQFLYTGVNLSGAEFGMGSLPGTYGSSYTYPTSAEADYFMGKGMNTFRLPFRWERLQSAPNTLINNPSATTPAEQQNYAEIQRMDTFVNYATGKGAYVLLDPHNFERYYPLASNFQQSSQGLIGGTTADRQTSYNSLNPGGNVVVTNAMFANFWGQVADHYKNNSHVIFDLMNEPANVSASALVTTDNAAIAAIRATGATNLIMIEGTSFTGAWTWTSSGNAAAMLNIVDSANNYAFEMHQYMDTNGSGTSASINNNDPQTGVSRITDATNWLETNHLKGFLGEFGVDNSIINKNNPNDPNTLGNEVLNNMFTYMQQHSSAWIGWSDWGGGPWWANNSLFHVDPVAGVDQNIMPVLQQYVVPEPASLVLLGVAACFLPVLRRRLRRPLNNVSATI